MLGREGDGASHGAHGGCLCSHHSSHAVTELGAPRARGCLARRLAGHAHGPPCTITTGTSVHMQSVTSTNKSSQCSNVKPSLMGAVWVTLHTMPPQPDTLYEARLQSTDYSLRLYTTVHGTGRVEVQRTPRLLRPYGAG